MFNDRYSVYSVVIELGAAKKGFPTGILGRALHSQVLEWFKIGEPSLAEELHQSQISPFSISPLIGKRRSKLTEEGDRFFFRISLLNGSLLQPLLKGLEQQDKQIVMLDKFAFRLCHIHILPGSHSLARTSSYALTTQAPISSKITLKFHTATSFKIDPNIIQPFPLGDSVFNSLLRRWNHFAPEELHFPCICWQILVAAFELKTYSIQLKKSEIGSEGWITYLFPDQEQAKIASVLSQFAFFSGVGRKTPMGMGQVSVNNYG